MGTKSTTYQHQLLKMQDTEKELKAVLQKTFEGQGQRMTMMSKLILAMIRMCTVNFAKLSLCLNPEVKRESNFKRIQRFAKQYRFDRMSYVLMVWSLYADKGSWVALSMDRTNWKFGRTNINILTIGISWRGTAIPLVWKMLDKRGKSNVIERRELLDELLFILNEEQAEKIRHILMDREFGDSPWITELKRRKIGFIIRIRVDSKIRKLGEMKEIKARDLFNSTDFKVLRKMRVVFGHRLYLGGCKSKDDTLVLISDKRLKHGRHLYAERWGIEVFFGSTKIRGFNFEDTHLTHPERIDTMMYIISIAFIWAFRTGEWLLEKGHEIIFKQIGERRTKLYSIFRIGLDYIRVKFLNFLTVSDEIKLLSCT